MIGRYQYKKNKYAPFELNYWNIGKTSNELRLDKKIARVHS